MNRAPLGMNDPSSVLNLTREKMISSIISSLSIAALLLGWQNDEEDRSLCSAGALLERRGRQIGDSSADSAILIVLQRPFQPSMIGNNTRRW